MAGVLDKPKAASPQAGDERERVGLHEGGWGRLFTVTRVVDAVRSTQDDEAGQNPNTRQQLTQLSEHLLKWFGQVGGFEQRIAQAYIDFKEPAGVQIVVVQPGEAFDEKLTEAVADLQWDLVHDERFRQLQIAVEIAPGPIGGPHANG